MYEAKKLRTRGHSPTRWEQIDWWRLSLSDYTTEHFNAYIPILYHRHLFFRSLTKSFFFSISNTILIFDVMKICRMKHYGKFYFIIDELIHLLTLTFNLEHWAIERSIIRCLISARGYLHSFSPGHGLYFESDISGGMVRSLMPHALHFYDTKIYQQLIRVINCTNYNELITMMNVIIADRKPTRNEKRVLST